MVKYRYNAAEKFRIQSINLLKQERQRIIEEEKNQNTQTGDTMKNTITNNMSKTIGIGGWNKGSNVSPIFDDKMEQILSEQKRAIQKIKQKQRQDIQALIKSQIDREIMDKVNIVKERRQKEKEEENMRELERIKRKKENNGIK